MKKNLRTKNMLTEKGFTLIEVLVSIGLFAAIAVMALTALLVVSNASHRSQNIRAIVDSLGYVVEDISRTAQDGTKYECGNVACTILEITTSNDSVTKFAFNQTNNTIEKTVGTGDAQVVSPASVKVDNLTFYVTDAGTVTLNPRVQIILQARIGYGGKYENSINLQTSVTKRQK